MDYNKTFQLRLDTELRSKIRKIREFNLDKYSSDSHVIRAGVNKMYRIEVEDKLKQKIEKEIKEKCMDRIKRKARLFLTKGENDCKQQSKW